MKKQLLLSFIFLALVWNNGVGQHLFEYADTLNKSRRNWVIGTEVVGATSSIFLLNEVWYKGFPKAPLHSFNDNAEWLQMDKAGHMMTSYYVGLAGNEALKWSGCKSKKATILGSAVGLLYLTGVEVLDGTSAQWGFSWGDMVANVAGFGWVVGQELTWQEQRIKLKFSSQLTTYAYYRPNVLGSTNLERLLKDYNGQTYWASFNIKSFAFKDHKHFPAWLNIAVGYGADEMITGFPESDFCAQNPQLCSAFDPHREWYLSLDADLTKIVWKRKIFKTIFGSFGWIKFPAPTLMLSEGKTKGYWFYF